MRERRCESAATALFGEQIVISTTEKDIVSEVVEQALIPHTKAK